MRELILRGLGRRADDQDAVANQESAVERLVGAAPAILVDGVPLADARRPLARDLDVRRAQVRRRGKTRDRLRRDAVRTPERKLRDVCALNRAAAAENCGG